MSGIIEGDIKKALGFGVMEIGSLKINLHLTTAKDIITYQTLPLKYIKSKEPTLEESLALQEGYRGYFIDYLSAKDPTLEAETIALFVAKNLSKLIEEFPIATGLRTKAEVEEYKAKVSEKEKNL